jgi:predicted DNA binding CopG/RHH family protein
VKEMISIRIDPKLLTKLRKLAAKKKVPYQTLLHDLLEDAVNKAA